MTEKKKYHSKRAFDTKYLDVIGLNVTVNKVK